MNDDGEVLRCVGSTVVRLNRVRCFRSGWSGMIYFGKEYARYRWGRCGPRFDGCWRVTCVFLYDIPENTFDAATSKT